MEIQETKWQLVDRDIFAQYRFATADELAAAYVAESYGDFNETKIITLYEMGQRCFSHALNGRQQRESLFMQRVLEAARAAA